MKLTNHMIALDFEHKKDYFPKEMGITVINNDFSVGETYHYYITDERVSNNSQINSKTFPEVWKEVQHLFTDDVLIISHSHGTEKKIINQCFKQYGIDKKYTGDDFFDTMWVIPAKLAEVCRTLDIATENHHRADADSRMAAEVFCKHMNRIVPDYSKINENVSMTGSIGFGDYDKEINYENALIGYCKRNNINNDEIVSLLGNEDPKRIVSILDGKIIDYEFYDDENFTIETKSDYWELNECRRFEEDLKYIYEMRFLNNQPMIPETALKRARI